MAVRIIKSVVTYLTVISIALLVYLFLPLLMLILLTAYLYRCLLRFYVKCFRSEFGSIVAVRSNMFASDLPGASPKSSIVKAVVFDGDVDFSHLRKDLLSKVYEKRKDGNLKYPELMQKLTEYGGYPFWEWDQHFDVVNHLHFGFEGRKTIDMDGFNNLTAKLLKQPFNKHRSPWEAFLFYIENPTPMLDGKSMFVMRYNHVLADGFTLVEMVAAANKIKLKPRVSKNTNMNIILRNLNRVISFMLAPFQITATLLTTANKRILKPKDDADLESIVVRHSKPIPIQQIKELKNRLRSSFPAILIAAFTGSLRKLMHENKIDVPYELHTVMPFPMTGHQDKLGNRLKLCTISLPVGIPDAKSRLKHIDSQLKALRYSRVPSQLYYFSLAIGILPIAVTRILHKVWRLSVFITIFDSPINNVSYDGHAITGLFGAPGLHQGNIGVGITCISYNNHVRVHMNFIESSVLKANADALILGLSEELFTLRTHCRRNTLQLIEEEEVRLAEPTKDK